MRKTEEKGAGVARAFSLSLSSLSRRRLRLSLRRLHSLPARTQEVAFVHSGNSLDCLDRAYMHVCAIILQKETQICFPFVDFGEFLFRTLSRGIEHARAVKK